MTTKTEKKPKGEVTEVNSHEVVAPGEGPVQRTAFTGDVITWVVDKSGRHEKDNAEPKSMAGKIIVREKLDAENQDKVVYTGNAYFKEPKGAFEKITADSDKDRNFPTIKEGFDAAFAELDDVVQKMYDEALGQTDSARVLDLNLLRCVFRDQALIEKIRAKQSRVATMVFPDEQEQRFMLQFLATHFPQLDATAPVAFVFRKELAGNAPVPWSRGKDDEGAELCVVSEAKKTPKSQEDLLRRVIGYRPFFTITICKLVWDEATQVRRQGILWWALDTCKIDGDRAWCAKSPNLAKLIKLFGPMALTESIRDQIGELVRTLKASHQLEFFAEEVEDDVKEVTYEETGKESSETPGLLHWAPESKHFADALAQASEGELLNALIFVTRCAAKTSLDIDSASHLVRIAAKLGNAKIPSFCVSTVSAANAMIDGAGGLEGAAKLAAGDASEEVTG